MRKGEKLLIALAVLGYGIIVIRHAWLSDDAYITFRTVDNFINGYGLTWNVAERVQVYTHPLWMLLLSAVYFLTREIFFSSHLLSIAISLLTVSLLVSHLADSLAAALGGVAVLALSKAFVDYSTSGLENPLTHLLLVAFVIVYLEPEINPKRVFILSLLTALGILNRMDTAVLFLPALGWSLLKLHNRAALSAAALGLVPALAWELFSLFYYGSLFPNTAFAKLNVGLISRRELVQHGLYYLQDSWQVDPLTLTTIALGAGLACLTRNWRMLPIIGGLVGYMLYIVWIGGDFMSGRFLAAPLLGATVVLVGSLERMGQRPRLALVALIAALGILAPYSPIRTPPGRNASAANPHSITDERANYYRNTGLLMAFYYPDLPDHDWALEGRAARHQGPAVVQKGSIGFFGYMAGPQVHIIDLVGLGDPLLARLPPTDPNWRIGHLGRTVPAGYAETLASGQNKILDRNLAAYYDRLMLVTRGNLFDVERLVTIWNWNIGAYDHYLDAYAFFRGWVLTQPLQITNPTAYPYVYAYVWNNGGAERCLLDDASQPGRVYTITWQIAASGITLEGACKQRPSSWRGLADAETLNVGVYFSAGPAATAYDMFERRLWFRLQANGSMTAVLPAVEWHNAAAPQGEWRADEIDAVMRDAFPYK